MFSGRERYLGGGGGGVEIEIQPVNKFKKETKEERQLKLRSEKISKLNSELQDIESGRKSTPSSKKPPAPSPSETPVPNSRRPSASNLSETPAQSPSDNNDADEEEAEKEELKQTPKKTPEQIKKEFLDRLEEKNKAATELDKYLNVASSLENDIKKVESERNFKTMKASALQKLFKVK
jgi:hypothetical protein